MKNKYNILYLGLSVLLFATACNQEQKNDEFEKNMSELINKKADLDELGSKEIPIEILRAIPSPLQITSALKKANISYNNQVINKNANLTNYNSSFSKALNLGIYGADLGYINFYERNDAVIPCLRNIKLLAEDLKVSQFFDFETIRKLAKNSNNMDSLIYISTNSFADMDLHLKKNNRRNLSVLVVYGGWVESFYLLLNGSGTPVTKMPENLKERVGEQKLVLGNLIEIFKNYKDQPKYLGLLKNLNELETIFNNVNITYTTGKTEKKVVDGVLTFVETKESKVEISDATLEEIKQKVNTIRESLI